MSFATQALRYGWVALASLGALTGTTIYVLNNQRHQVKPEDVIELVLGVTERCLATQTGISSNQVVTTNEVGTITTNWIEFGVYAVSPPTFVRSWMKTNVMVTAGTAYTVCYTSYWPSTTGVGVVHSYTSNAQPSINYAASWTATNGWVWTNVSRWPSMTVTDTVEIVTNTIGWHTDLGMLILLDTRIKGIVPLYLNTNTVYNGSTNISFLTVTGLWASLNIGDGTNRFTREPAWTNTFTNWIINYTSYWPSTSGVAVTNCYTSDYRQVVNYAASWTATGGHVWVTSSNWASEVVIVTNAATYDDYPWQIYAEDLEERYKVLEALKMLPLRKSCWSETNFIGMSNINYMAIGADTDGAMSDGHFYHGSEDLGEADYSLTNIYADARRVRTPPSYWLRGDYISFGVPGGRINSPAPDIDGISMVIELERFIGSQSAPAAPYKAQITLLGTPHVRIYYAFEGFGANTNYTITYTPTSVDVSGMLRPWYTERLYVYYYPIVTFPFLYCTNKWW